MLMEQAAGPSTGGASTTPSARAQPPVVPPGRGPRRRRRLLFQWRASRAGREKFHSGMVSHAAQGPHLQECQAARRGPRRIGPGGAGPTADADIAVLYDWNGWWGLEETFGLPRNDFSYVESVMRNYTPLWKAHYPVDVVSTASSLAPYKVLLVPNAYLIDDDGSPGSRSSPVTAEP